MLPFHPSQRFLELPSLEIFIVVDETYLYSSIVLKTFLISVRPIPTQNNEENFGFGDQLFDISPFFHFIYSNNQ